MLYSKMRRVFACDYDTNVNPASPKSVKHIALESIVLNDIGELRALETYMSINLHVRSYNRHIARNLHSLRIKTPALLSMEVRCFICISSIHR
jgi:hypothetical protein